MGPLSSTLERNPGWQAYTPPIKTTGFGGNPLPAVPTYEMQIERPPVAADCAVNLYYGLTVAEMARDFAGRAAAALADIRPTPSA